MTPGHAAYIGAGGRFPEQKGGSGPPAEVEVAAPAALGSPRRPRGLPPARGGAAGALGAAASRGRAAGDSWGGSPAPAARCGRWQSVAASSASHQPVPPRKKRGKGLAGAVAVAAYGVGE